MKKVMVVLASLTMAVMISGAALAAGPSAKGKGLYKGQQLTQEQVEQVKKARAKFLNDTLDLRKKMAVKAIELKTLNAQAKPDQAKIKALAIELVDLRSAIAKKKIEAFSGLPVGMGFGRGGYGKGGGHGRGFGPGGCPGFGGGYGKGAGGGNRPCWQ